MHPAATNAEEWTNAETGIGATIAATKKKKEFELFLL